MQDDYCDTIIDIVENDKDTWSKNLVNVNALTTGWDGLRYPILRKLVILLVIKYYPQLANLKIGHIIIGKHKKRG